MDQRADGPSSLDGEFNMFKAVEALALYASVRYFSLTEKAQV